jgi:hypothetical protein
LEHIPYRTVVSNLKLDSSSFEFSLHVAQATIYCPTTHTSQRNFDNDQSHSTSLNIYSQLVAVFYRTDLLGADTLLDAEQPTLSVPLEQPELHAMHSNPSEHHELLVPPHNI